MMWLNYELHMIRVIYQVPIETVKELIFFFFIMVCVYFSIKRLLYANVNNKGALILCSSFSSGVVPGGLLNIFCGRDVPLGGLTPPLFI